VTTLALDARRLRAKAIALLLKAEQSGDLNTALRGIKEAAGCLLLEARILGEIDNGPPVSVSVENQAPLCVRFRFVERQQQRHKHQGEDQLTRCTSGRVYFRSIIP
jgi:hypothetical protein